MSNPPQPAHVPLERYSGGNTADEDANDLTWRQPLPILEPDVETICQVRDSFIELASALIDSGPWSLCWIGIFDRKWDGLALQCGASHTRKGSPVAELKFPDSAAIRLACQQAAEQGQPLTLSDARYCSQSFRELQGQDPRQRIGALLIVPLQLGEYPGAVWFGVDKPREFSETELAYAQYAAATIIHLWRKAQRLAGLEHAVRIQGEQLDELARLHTAAGQQREHLEEISRAHDTLLPLVLNEQGITALIEAAAALAQKPVLLFDRFERLVAHSGVPAATLQNAESGLGPHLRMYFDRDGAKADFVTIGGQRFLIVPLFSERRTLGNLCINFPQPPSGDRDTRVAEHIGMFFALELLKQRIRLDVQLRLSSDFFRSLLAETGQSPQTVANRASLFGLDLVRPSAALRVRITPLPSGDWFATLSATAWLLRAKLAEVGASAVVSPSSDFEIVIVVNADPAPLLREQILPAVRATLNEILGRHGRRFVLDIGIGTIGVGIDGIRASHDTAVKALALIDALGRHGTDLDITDFATYGLLLGIDALEQQRYIHTVLGPIEQYDTQHTTDLLKTLECYLDMLGSVQRTAEKLYLHPTTVRYRLTRVEELTGLQLDNSEHRLALSLALHLHHLSAAHPPAGRTT